MFKKAGCLLPTLAVLLFLTYISLRQGINTIFFEDWSDDYEMVNARIIGIVEGMAEEEDEYETNEYVLFIPVVEYEYHGKVNKDTLDFMADTQKVYYEGDNLEVSVNKSTGKITNGVAGGQTATGVVNVIMGLMFLSLCVLIIKSLWRQILAGQKKKMQ